MYPYNEEAFKAWAIKNGYSHKWISGESRRIGTKVHDWVQDYFVRVPKCLISLAMSEKEEMYLKSVKSFLRAFEVLRSEQVVYCKEYGFAGRYDAIVRRKGTNGTRSLVDFKTFGAWNGTYNRKSQMRKFKKVATQLSMYRYANRNVGKIKLIVFKPDGTFDEEDLKVSDDWKTWMKENKDKLDEIRREVYEKAE